jgi:hypothetical protein
MLTISKLDDLNAHGFDDEVVKYSFSIFTLKADKVIEVNIATRVIFFNWVK